MSKFNKLFILTIDCEGEYYSELNGVSLEVAVRNIYDTVSLLEDRVDKIVLMSTPAFVERAHEMGLLHVWLKNVKVEAGLHIHPDDLPEAIIRGLEFYRKEEKLLTEYSYSEQEQIIKKTMDYLKIFHYEPLWFRGGFYSIDDNTVKALKSSTGIIIESHNTYREQYKIKNTGGIESIPVLAHDHRNELRFENSDANSLYKLMEENHLKYDCIVGMTHSYALDMGLIENLIIFAQRKNGDR